MRDHDGRAPAHHRFVAGNDLRFRRRVERAGRFVEHQHGWIGKKRTRDRETLSFTRRETSPALANGGVHAIREVSDEIVEAGGVRCGTHFRIARGGTSVANVLSDARVEDEWILIDDHHVAPERGE